MKQGAICIIFATFVALIAADGEPGKWSVQDASKNVTCLVAQMNIKANFSYQTNNDTMKIMKNVLYELPIDSKEDPAKSSCGKDKDVLSVKWEVGNNFELIFSLENSTYNLSNFTITLNVSNLFNDSMANQTIIIAYFNDDSSYKTPSNFSYHCNREQVLNANNNSTIVLSKLQFEAFKTGNNKNFDLAQDCDSNIKPDIIPVAVGISLIALIIIVLIAYIVGRRRSQARGYLNIM